MQNSFTHHVPIEEALNWELNGLTLNQALVDEAENAARKHHPNISEIDTETTITRTNTSFNITFTW